MYSGSRGTVTVMAPQWQLERIEVSVAAMLSRVAQESDSIEGALGRTRLYTNACRTNFTSHLRCPGPHWNAETFPVRL